MTGPPVLWGSFAFVLCVVGVLDGQPAESRPRAVVLGIAQDGGVPHIGCRQERCVLARRDPSRRERVACLGLVDEQAGRRFLIDATPDLPSQL
jgi:pyrroloquinoline quinone biosynthesis protein B